MGENAELAVRLKGQGYPILFIHGWTMKGYVESLDFEPIFSKPTSTDTAYQRIYIDLPGMGGSAADGITDLDSILDRVSLYIETNMMPCNFLLIGTSCGAYIARALARRFDGCVDGLLLRVPVVEPESARRDVSPFVPEIKNEALMASIPEAEREAMGDVPVQTPEYVEALRLKARTAWVPAVEASDEKVLDLIRGDLTRYRLTAPMHGPADPFLRPTLVVTGRQDTDVGYRDAWRLMAHYPRATFVALDRAIHGFPVDEGEKALFEALVRDWLRRAEETRRLLPLADDTVP